MKSEALTLGIAGLATAGVIFRPFHWPEAIWAVAGAVLLVALGLMPASGAWDAIAKGADVCMFLTGMLLLSEVARQEGLFDFLAAVATRRAGGSSTRLFLLVYLVGVVVTVFLSNDATAVVLTPAVFAATQAAKIDRPLPYLFICAMVANAASFVLPISNPANLVVYGAIGMPPLWVWLKTFFLASCVSVVATYAALRWWLRRDLQGRVAAPEEEPALTGCGKIAAAGIGLTAAALLVASAVGRDLGAPTLIAGAATMGLVLAIKRSGPLPLLREISWGVLPLVAGLFIFVEALNRIGLTAQLAGVLKTVAQMQAFGPFLAGASVAIVSNLVNNLPAGLIAASALHLAESPADMTSAVLVGVDLGPNFSVTGSLATILWLAALRRENLHVSALDFLIVGAVATPPALVLSLAALRV
ncbi:arsenic transporter [Rhodoblastus sp.]|uniref:arsenic transporter n=1 Tax=Rhodoblastus sp. TaxID=1962975 RepID=UPI003F9E9EBD